MQTQYQKFTFTVNKWRHFPLCVRIFQGAKQREAPPDRGLRVVRLKSQHYSVDSFCGILLPLSEVTENAGMKLTHTWSMGNSTTAAKKTRQSQAWPGNSLCMLATSLVLLLAATCENEAWKGRGKKIPETRKPSLYYQMLECKEGRKELTVLL